MPIPNTDDLGANSLLASLPAAALGRMLPHFSLVQLSVGEMLYEAGSIHSQVFFPVGATVSLSYMGSGGPAPVSLVASEGVVGIPLFLNGAISPCRAVVSIAGAAYQLGATHLTREFNRPGQSLRLFLAYARQLTEQMVQTASCRVLEPIDQSLCLKCDHAKLCPHVDGGRR